MRLSVLYRAIAERRRLVATLAQAPPDPLAATFERQATIAERQEDAVIAVLSQDALGPAVDCPGQRDRSGRPGAAERRPARPNSADELDRRGVAPPVKDPMMKTLIRYALFPLDEQFVLQLTDDTGATTELQLSAVQLETLIDDADLLLDDAGSPPEV